MIAPDPLEIAAEHLGGEGLRQADIDRFRSAGVPAGAMFRSAYGWPAIMLRDRILDDAGRFEFARHWQDEPAQAAFTVPVFDSCGDLVDIVAWRPPNSVALLLGRVALLGEEQVYGPRFDEPLQVHSGVLDWFRAGRVGVVIVDAAPGAAMLREAGPLMVDDVEFGRRLREVLTAPMRAPEILVMAREACAA